MSSFHLTIVTPTGKFFEDDVDFVSVPGAAGSFGILSRHTPFVSSLKKGTLRIKQSTGDKNFSIESGLLEMNEQNKWLILSNHIENSS